LGDECGDDDGAETQGDDDGDGDDAGISCVGAMFVLLLHQFLGFYDSVQDVLLHARVFSLFQLAERG